MYDRAGDAIRLFKKIEFQNVEPNEITMVNVLVACAQSRDLKTGRWVHERIHQIGFNSGRPNSSSNVILDTAILDMYAKCGSLKVAKELFNEMPRRNVVAWNSMNGAYNQYNRTKEALGHFVGMRIVGFNPDEVMMLSSLGACAHLGALGLGQGLLGYLEKVNLGKDVAIAISLMDMYANI